MRRTIDLWASVIGLVGVNLTSVAIRMVVRWLGTLAILPFAVAAGACSADLAYPGDVQATAEVTAQTSSALLGSSILWLDGTYGAGCTGRASGNWSVRVSGMATMDYAALTVVQNNTACVLTLTKIIADQTYTGTPAIGMTGSYQGSASTFTPSSAVSFYANADLSSTSFASNFVVQVLYSNNPNDLTGSLGSGYVSVTATSTTTDSQSPNYTLDLTTGALTATVSDTTSTVSAVSGTAQLDYVSIAGGGYYVDQGTLPSSPTFAQLDTAYGSASTTSISGNGTVTIAASAFGLTGVNISSAVTRTIVIQRVNSGVHSYETFAVTFGCGGACVCPTGESSKADSTSNHAANVCCASAGTTLNCNGTCVDTLVDANNCGACGTVCSAATPHCSSGSCVASCPTGSTLCSGICVDTVTDNANCGSCSNACAAGSYCSSSQCTNTCNGSAYTPLSSVTNGTYAIESNAGFYLDDPSAGGAGTGLDQWAYTGTNQQWTVTLVSGTQYKILANNGLALTAGSGTGVQVTLTTYTGATTQLWTFTTNSSGYNIVNTASCLALDDAGGGTSLPINVSATTFSTSTVTSHYWTLTTSSSITAPIATGSYEFLDSAAYALDDSNGGGAGTAVGQWIYSPGSNQKWTVTLVSGVQYKIIGDGGAALTASAGNGTLPNLSAYTGATSQLWVFVPNGSSYYVINVGYYVALDDAGGGQGVGCNKEAWSTTSASQVWSIAAAPQTTCSSTSVTTNTYSSSNGHIKWTNTGSIAEVNPEINFGLPSGATLNTGGCALGNQTVPGSITAVTCIQAGTTVYYEFLGSLAASSSITVYYTTQNSSEAVATGITVAANSCQ